MQIPFPLLWNCKLVTKVHSSISRSIFLKVQVDKKNQGHKNNKLTNLVKSDLAKIKSGHLEKMLLVGAHALGSLLIRPEQESDLRVKLSLHGYSRSACEQISILLILLHSLAIEECNIFFMELTRRVKMCREICTRIHTEYAVQKTSRGVFFN